MVASFYKALIQLNTVDRKEGHTLNMRKVKSDGCNRPISSPHVSVSSLFLMRAAVLFLCADDIYVINTSYITVDNGYGYDNTINCFNF